MTYTSTSLSTWKLSTYYYVGCVCREAYMTCKTPSSRPIHGHICHGYDYIIVCANHIAPHASNRSAK